MDVALDVKGMSCGHCEKAVKDALKEIKGVNKVEVHLDSGKVNVDYDQNVVSLDKLCEVVEEQGYDVIR